jgi:hypothetical protein
MLEDIKYPLFLKIMHDLFYTNKKRKEITITKNYKEDIKDLASDLTEG